MKPGAVAVVVLGREAARASDEQREDDDQAERDECRATPTRAEVPRDIVLSNAYRAR